jgi:hypothetical protein
MLASNGRYVGTAEVDPRRFELMAEKYRLISFLASMKRSRLARKARRDAKSYLKQNGGVFSSSRSVHPRMTSHSHTHDGT